MALQFFKSQFTRLAPPTGIFSGKTIIITGANSGLGREAARHYVNLGTSKMILAVRSMAKGHNAKQDIEHTTNCAKNIVEVWELDMASYASVLSFADRVNDELDRVDIFHANAGIAPGSYQTAEDNELAITVNCISTFLLAGVVMPKLKETATRYNTRPTFSINVSGVHEHTQLPQKSAPEGRIFEAVNAQGPFWTPWDEMFAISKLFVIFGVRALAEEHPARGYPVTINMVNPGLCRTQIGREWSVHPESLRIWIFGYLFGRTAEEGSRTLVHAGSAGATSHGEYMDDCAVGAPAPFVTSREGKLAQDRVWVELQKKLDAIKPGVTSNF